MGVSGSPLSACLEDPKLRTVEVPEAMGSPWGPLVPPTPADIDHHEAQPAQLPIKFISAAPVTRSASSINPRPCRAKPADCCTNLPLQVPKPAGMLYI